MVRRFLVTARLSFTLHISPPTLIMPSPSNVHIPALVGAFVAVGAIVVACYFIPRVLGACAARAREEEERERRAALPLQTPPLEPLTFARNPLPRRTPRPITLAIELQPIRVIHVAPNQTDPGSPEKEKDSAHQGLTGEAVWEIGTAV